MAAALKRPILVVAGVGNGTGTGASTARVFAKAGYKVALIARNADHLNKTAEEIKSAGGEAAPFPVASYTPDALTSAFSAIAAHWPDAAPRAALWNAGHGVWKPFLSLTPEDVQTALDTNVIAAFAFARAAILAFRENPVDEEGAVGGRGKRGTLLFTGATASVRGNTTTSAFAAAKHGLRALSQSLAKEFGKENIHVAHAIIDGGIITDRTKGMRNNAEWAENENVRLNPDSIAQSYLYLANQDRSAWTWELDLRPAHEKW